MAHESSPTTVLPRARRGPTHDEIAQRAYELWEDAGRPVGCELEHGIAAERESQTNAVIASTDFDDTQVTAVPSDIVAPPPELPALQPPSFAGSTARRSPATERPGRPSRGSR